MIALPHLGAVDWLAALGLHKSPHVTRVKLATLVPADKLWFSDMVCCKRFTKERPVCPNTADADPAKIDTVISFLPTNQFSFSRFTHFLPIRPGDFQGCLDSFGT